MAVYQQLQEGDYVITATINAAAWIGTRGKDIIEEFAVSDAPMPFLEDRIANAMHLFNREMQNARKWKPTGASAAGGGMLDAQNLTGECAQLVSAFKALLRSPAPYGFGLPDTDIASEEWPVGREILLFVVKHTGPVFGLYPNVLKTDWDKLAGANRFQGMYGWGNHKVLRVNCGGRTRYFDPCYNNVYLLASDMADWVLNHEEMALLKGHPVVTKYKGRSRFGQAVSFGSVGSATPDILEKKIKTMDNYFPVLVGPL
jgi:hypothetical protein